MAYQDIAVTHPLDRVTEVAIDRPAVRNGYRSQTCRELVRAIEDFVGDDDQRVLVITGARGNFCSGGDVSDQEDAEAGSRHQFGHGRTMRDGMHRVIRALHRCDKPTIAKIDGTAVSGGLALALACDMRIGSNQARLGDVSGRVGLLPDEGGAWLFPRSMGWDRALRMSLLHEIYDAATAESLGLLTEVHPRDELDQRVLAVAQVLTENAPLAARMTKRMMRAAQTSTLDQALDLAEIAVDVINVTDDVREGVEAFLNKRTPRFRGR